MISDQGPELMFQYNGSASALADDIDDDGTKRPALARGCYILSGGVMCLTSVCSVED